MVFYYPTCSLFLHYGLSFGWLSHTITCRIIYTNPFPALTPTASSIHCHLFTKSLSLAANETRPNHIGKSRLVPILYLRQFVKANKIIFANHKFTKLWSTAINNHQRHLHPRRLGSVSHYKGTSHRLDEAMDGGLMA